MKIREVLQGAIQTLSNEGVESPRLDAELLLAHVLEANRSTILAWPERRLTPKQLTSYRALIIRRARREPLAYIVGHREFFDLDFVIDARVLVPRPETELLVEHALRLARDFIHGPRHPSASNDARLGHCKKQAPLARDEAAAPGSEGDCFVAGGAPCREKAVPRGLCLADVGAGSGAIAVTLAVHLPQAKVYALDGSAEALAVTAKNAQGHGVAGRVCCLQGDLLEPLPVAVDLVTANLPYVTTAEWEGLPPEIRDHEPHAALDGGPDGLALICRLLETVGEHLRPGGAVLLEIGASQGEAVTRLAEGSFPCAEVRLYQDYAGLDRLVVVKT